MGRDIDDRNRSAGLAWAAWYDALHRARSRGASASVVRAKHFIDGRFVKPVPLDAIAVEARLSKYHFVRAFRRIFRQTPHRYLVERRIARARALLEHSDLSVTAICFEVGFESVGSFVARFRELVGEAPGRYRRRFARQGSVDLRAIPGCLYEAFSARPGPRPVDAHDRNSREAPEAPPQ